MSRAATLEIVELYRAFIIEFIDTFRIEITQVRKVRTLGLTPMQNPKRRTFAPRGLGLRGPCGPRYRPGHKES